MKKFLITISLITFLLTAAPYAQAQAPDYGNQGNQQSEGGSAFWGDSTGDQLICRGNRDYGVFLSALISYDDFVEYWKDIFVRYNANICLYEDIDSLLKRITKVRKQIREAFYVCADTSRMESTYYRLEAELFFLREYVSVGGGEIVVKNSQELADDLKSYFVINKGFFSDEEIVKLFDEFLAKYVPRLKTYEDCSDPSWENLAAKWNEFKDTAGGFGPAIKQAGASISKRYERMANTPIKQGAKFFGDFLDMNINGLPPLEGLEQIGEELERNFPAGYTFNQMQAAQSLAQQTFDESTMLASYEAQYRALYGETSDEYNKQIMVSLNALDKIINDTGPFQNQTFQCVRRMVNKQC